MQHPGLHSPDRVCPAFLQRPGKQVSLDSFALQHGLHKQPTPPDPEVSGALPYPHALSESQVGPLVYTTAATTAGFLWPGAHAAQALHNGPDRNADPPRPHRLATRAQNQIDHRPPGNAPSGHE